MLLRQQGAVVDLNIEIKDKLQFELTGIRDLIVLWEKEIADHTTMLINVQQQLAEKTTLLTQAQQQAQSQQAQYEQQVHYNTHRYFPPSYNY